MLKQICHVYVDQIERIIGGQESRPIHEPVFIPTIPVDYDSFVYVDTDLQCDLMLTNKLLYLTFVFFRLLLRSNR